VTAFRECRQNLPFPYSTLSLRGVPIRLTEERWFHITKHHQELRNLREFVLATVARPDSAFLFPPTGEFAAVSRHSELIGTGVAPYLVVHYREITNHDGFIVTAFPMSLSRMKRRFGRWQRLK
jgi:hypothetical protein